MRYRSAGRVQQTLSGAPIRATLVAAFVIAIGLLFFGRGNATFDGIRLVVERATGGFYEFIGPPIATGRAFVGNVLRVFEVYRENDKLKTRNAELKAWQARAEALQQRVTRYEALLEMPLEPDVQYRTGRILDDPGGPFVRTFRINLGTKNGVVEGQAVTDERGLLGRVVAAGKTASRILLITDLNSRVPVVVAPSGVRGMLIGRNDGLPVITYLPRDFGISVGDKVMTSGHGGLIPPDIPVGTITAVHGDQVVVDPATQFASVNYVRVLDYSSPVADVPYSTQGPPILNAPPVTQKPSPDVAANPPPAAAQPTAQAPQPAKPTRPAPPLTAEARTAPDRGDAPEAAPADPEPQAIDAAPLPPPGAGIGGAE